MDAKQDHFPTETAADDPARTDQADGATTPAASSADQQIQELRDKYLRVAAEYDNFRKRVQRERQDTSSRAQAELAKHFVDVIDDIARFAHLDAATVDPATVVSGVEMVERKLLKALGAAGFQVITPVDQAFDPALHEAVGTMPALSREDDHVVGQVFQPGYMFNGQLLRPARVVVKQWTK
jgi:molecular chaperone GrpE